MRPTSVSTRLPATNKTDLSCAFDSASRIDEFQDAACGCDPGSKPSSNERATLCAMPCVGRHDSSAIRDAIQRCLFSAPIDQCLPQLLLRGRGRRIYHDARRGAFGLFEPKPRDHESLAQRQWLGPVYV